jgi:hypothetical protein
VAAHGFAPVEMGAVDNTSPWMNAQIFESILRAPLNIVDLTGVRQNCFMELGYAFGAGKRVLITAREDTRLPFDSSAIDTRMWNPTHTPAQLIEELQDYWRRNIDRPKLATLSNPL